VMRQAVQIFTLERTAADILSLLDAFNKQWDLFKTSMEKMGKRIEEAQKEYNSLVTTRSNQLERPLRKIEDLKLRKGIEIPLPAGSTEFASLESAEGEAESPGSK
jgi:DNA recombination protein RmuC